LKVLIQAQDSQSNATVTKIRFNLMRQLYNMLKITGEMLCGRDRLRCKELKPKLMLKQQEFKLRLMQLKKLLLEKLKDKLNYLLNRRLKRKKRPPD
jgi:hypothetical protein